MDWTFTLENLNKSQKAQAMRVVTAQVQADRLEQVSKSLKREAERANAQKVTGPITRVLMALASHLLTMAATRARAEVLPMAREIAVGKMIPRQMARVAVIDGMANPKSQCRAAAALMASKESGNCPRR
jgi:hypothetical protein